MNHIKLPSYPFVTEKGIVTYYVYLIFLFAAIYKVLPVSYNLFVYLSLLGLAFVGIYWLFLRWNYIYFNSKMHLVFAVRLSDPNDASQINEYLEFIRLVQEEIKDAGLASKVKVDVKPYDKEFESHEQAEAKIKHNLIGSTLLITGVSTKAKSEVRYKLNFHYEFSCPGGEEKFYRKIIGSQVSNSLLGRDWRLVDDPGSRTILSKNLFQVTTYILAISLASLGELDECLIFLKPVIKHCNENVPKNGPLIADLRLLLRKIFHLKFTDASWNFDIDKMKEYLESLHNVDRSYYPGLLARATTCELLGDRAQAIRYSELAEVNHPKKVYIHMFNFLYFTLTDGEYSKALEIYNRMLSTVQDVHVTILLSFLDYVYEKTGNIILLFNAGLVANKWAEKGIGDGYLKQFVVEAGNLDGYKLLVLESEKILKK